MATHTIGAAGMATALHHLLTRWLSGDSRLDLAPVPGWVRQRLDSVRGDLAVLAGDADPLPDAQALLLAAELLVDGADDLLGDASGHYGVLNSALAMADLQGEFDQAAGDDDDGEE